MDNIQNWIYLILGAVYFLSKLRKKNIPAAPESQDKGGTTKKKVKTFEELLGEFTGLNKLDKAEDEDVKVTVDEKIPAVEKENTITRNPISDDKTSEPVSELAFPKIARLNKDLHFKEYAVENSQDRSKKITAREIRKELKSPRGIKKAIILSEILKRKY
tara:strand:- start:1480 stop:1959 length:480 start_codon:yes stop_codon:yes gene_type:complete